MAREQTTRFGLRLPTSLFEKLREKAGESGRSINQEIVEILEVHLGADPAVTSMVEELIQALHAYTQEGKEVMIRIQRPDKEGTSE